MDGAPLRLFVALWPTPAARRALHDWQRQWRWPERAAPVPAAHLHLTLWFLGAVPAAHVAAIQAALQASASRQPRFVLRLGGADGSVDGAADAGIVGGVQQWAGGTRVLRPQAPAPELQRLHQALGDALRAQGLALEARAFRPHVTLARRAAGAQPPPAPLPALHWPVNACALVQSAGGYRVLQRFPLAPSG